MNVKKARKLRDGLLIAGALMMFLGAGYPILFVPGAIIAVSCLIPHFLYNVCPHCGKQLGRGDGPFCQFCGKPVD